MNQLKRIQQIMSNSAVTKCLHCGKGFIPFGKLNECPICGHLLNSIDELEIDDSFGELDIETVFGD